MSGVPWPSADATNDSTTDPQHVVLPPAPQRRRPNVQEQRKAHWSRNFTDYLRRDCGYHWIPVKKLLEEFKIERNVLDEVTRDNHRMSFRTRPATETTPEVEEIKGNRSLNSRKSH